MVQSWFALAALAGSAAAWPMVMEQDMLLKRAASGRLNTGAGHPNPTFDAQSQYVDVSDNGPNPFIPPTSGQLRGQCPGRKSSKSIHLSS